MNKKKAEKMIKRNISIEMNPKPGWDVYVVDFYFHGRRIGTIEIDGIELEHMGR